MCEAFFRGAPCPRAPFGQRGAAHGGFAAARSFGEAETRGAPIFCDADIHVLRCRACSVTEKVNLHKLSLHNANIRYRKVVRKYCSCDVKTLSLLCRQLPFKNGSLLRGKIN